MPGLKLEPEKFSREFMQGLHNFVAPALSAEKFEVLDAEEFGTDGKNRAIHMKYQAEQMGFVQGTYACNVYASPDLKHVLRVMWPKRIDD